MNEAVLITGGTGYVASWCIAGLLDRGYTVRTTIRSQSKQEAVRESAEPDTDPGDRLQCVVADLNADDGWDAAMADVDYVLHVAQPLTASSGADAEALIAPARDGMVRVLRAAAGAGVKRVVATSAANTASPSSYTEDSVSDESLWTDPDDPTLIPYRRAKTIGEQAAWAFMADEPSGPMTLATVLPGAVFGPVRSSSAVGSAGIIARMLNGQLRGMPRIGLEVVDVRDLADLHIRAMTDPAAAGQRFLATGDFLWMSDIATILKDHLGDQAAKVSTRQLPDLAVRFIARFIDRSLRDMTPGLGRRARHTTKKAESVLGWTRRPVVETITDCAQSLIDLRVG